MDVDDVLKELVERKTRMQSYAPFNLEATVSELNSDYTRALSTSSRARDLKRELRNGDITHNLDELSNTVSSRTQQLVEHNKEESQLSISKFDEMMARLKSTAAAHKASIRNGTTDQAADEAMNKFDAGENKDQIKKEECQTLPSCNVSNSNPAASVPAIVEKDLSASAAAVGIIDGDTR